jgi:hypothetical protein
MTCQPRLPNGYRRAFNAASAHYDGATFQQIQRAKRLKREAARQLVFKGQRLMQIYYRDLLTAAALLRKR